MKKKIFHLFIFIISLIVANLSLAETSAYKNNATFSIEEATINSIHTAIRNHQITCEQLVDLYLDRIKKYNLSVQKQAPINAIAEINPNVLNEARQLDQAFAKNQFEGSLFCIPVLLKDNIDTYDSTSTSGSLALLGNQPIRDAFLAEKLRKAGAIILGKGTMDEFASGISGMSGRNGRTGNVYDTSQNSGGSSSGPATAVSANFAMIGIGTDNSGSVRIPAAFNGIVGLRPSTGLISQRGIFPRGNMDGIAGPLARTVEDLTVVLDVIAQPDPSDKKTLNIPRPKTYMVYLNENGLQGKRIGIIRKVGQLDTFKNMPQDVKDALQNSLQKMQALGVTIVSDINLPRYNLDRQYNEAGELEDINDYLSSFPSVRKNYRDICESNRTSMFGNTKDCLQFIRKLPKKYSQRYYQVLNIFQKNKNYVEKIMDQQHLDALLIPVSSTGSSTYNVKAIMNESVASNAGLPGITLNMGYTKDKMPIGIELIGKQYSEGKLIEMVYAYEKHSQPRIMPSMPEPNSALEQFDIPEYNNLLTNIGYDTYNQVLKKSKPDQFYNDLTPEIFRNIVNNELMQDGGFVARAP